MIRRTFTLSITIMLLLAACNMPIIEPATPISADDGRLTAAAATVIAYQTTTAQDGNGNGTPPTATHNGLIAPTAISTFTPVPTSTEDPLPCESAVYVADVTIPDGTKFGVNQTFTKTWRLTNNGRCPWLATFELVFASGDKMGGPNNKPATADPIEPGQQLEVSVQLTSPSEPGIYRGYWNLRNASQVAFTSPTFWVEIEVLPATERPAPTTRTISLSPINEGGVRADGVTNEYPYAGDSEGNNGLQAFLQFDTSIIPAGARIDEVAVHFGNFISLGQPFETFGCLHAYPGIFFPLDASDYMTDEPTGAVIRWCNYEELGTSFKDPDVRAMLIAGQTDDNDNLFELRLQFKQIETNNDDDADQIQFGTVSLKVTYTVQPEP